MKNNQLRMITVLIIIFAAAAVISSVILNMKTNRTGEENVNGTAETAADGGYMMNELNAALKPVLPADKYRTTYEIFTGSFCDGNGDGTGDLKGITERLDYINNGDPSSLDSLGASQIWLTPVFPSPTYHKYDVTDYKDIDKDFGTLEDMDALVKACHERGVRLILDFPVNHTSVEHPWFVQAAEYLKGLSGEEKEALREEGSGRLVFTEQDIAECPYLSYFNFTLEKAQGYEPLQGTGDPQIYYEARFWSGMPDLDLADEAVKKEIADIVSFWLERGIDGFRLDAVGYYFTDDRQQSIDFLAWLNDTVKAVDPDAYLVGEAWENQEIYARFYESGIDSLFDFAFAGPDGRITQTVRGSRSAAAFVEDMEKEEKLYGSYSPLAVNAPFYTNHDMARSTGYYAYDDGSRTKFSGALNLLMTGNAFIYYGEEVGLKGSGKDENKRAPMPWSTAEAGTDGMTAGPPAMDPQQAKFGTVQEQDKDPDSVLNYYRNAVRVRNAFPVIAKGRTGNIAELSGEEIGAFTRTCDGEEPVLVVFNTAGEARQADLRTADGCGEYTVLSAVLTVSGEPVEYSDGVLTLPPFGIAVFTAGQDR